MDDSQLEEFLNLLVVDINAKSYEEQEKQIFTQMCKIFKCDMFEAEYYYYNNALRIVKDIATEQAEKKRVLSKHEFLGLINHKGMLFDSWYIEFKGIKQYCKDIKTQYFTKFNISPFERFFLIQYDELSTDQEVADLLLLIAKRWSKISQRTSKPFCPFVYIHGISAERLISIKNIITNSGVNICDGYNYLGAKYNADMMLKKTNYYIGIQLKILNEKQYLNSLLKNASGVKEIYQFYIDTPFWENNQYDNVKIPIKRTTDIGTIIDLSGVPFDVLSITVSLISRVLFEYGYYYKRFRCDRNPMETVNNDIPLLLVYEEAHKYVPNNDLAKYRASKESIERIAKEGRKYGVTLLLASQRPSEISETIFSQCNNFLALRLTNPNDQNYVKRLLPDSLGNIVEKMPSLRAGECLLIGDAVVIPSIVQVEECNPSPSSNDIPYYQLWREEWKELDIEEIKKLWIN